MEKSRKVRPLLAGATALLFSAGLLVGGVVNAAQAEYRTYTAADKQLTDAINSVNGSVQAKSDADAQAAQQAQQDAQASLAGSPSGQSASSGGDGGSYSGSYGSSNRGGLRGYRPPAASSGSGYVPQQHYSAPAAPVPAAPSPAPAPSTSHNACIHVTYPDGSFTDECNYLPM